MKISPALVLAVSGFENGYTGKSYKNNGIYDFTIENKRTAKVLLNLENKLKLDWFKPHNGATFDIGTKVQIMTEPQDKKTFEAALRQSG
jgi:hypothetical protein